MDAKAFLELNDRMIAFNTLMKGELAKEVQAAKEALDLLGGAKTAKASMDALAKEKAAVEAYKASVEANLQEAQDALEARKEELAKLDLEISVDKASLESDQLAFSAYKADFESKAADAQAALQKTTKELEMRSAQVEADRIALDKGFADIAKREQAVADKLAAMKAIV